MQSVFKESVACILICQYVFIAIIFQFPVLQRDRCCDARSCKVKMGFLGGKVQHRFLTWLHHWGIFLPQGIWRTFFYWHLSHLTCTQGTLRTVILSPLCTVHRCSQEFFWTSWCLTFPGCFYQLSLGTAQPLLSITCQVCCAHHLSLVWPFLGTQRTETPARLSASLSWRLWYSVPSQCDLILSVTAHNASVLCISPAASPFCIRHTPLLCSKTTNYLSSASSVLKRGFPIESFLTRASQKPPMQFCCLFSDLLKPYAVKGNSCKKINLCWVASKALPEHLESFVCSNYSLKALGDGSLFSPLYVNSS